MSRIKWPWYRTEDKALHHNKRCIIILTIWLSSCNTMVWWVTEKWHGRPVMQNRSLKVHSYYTAIVSRCRYSNYISAASHHRITVFQVKINLTFMGMHGHRNAVTSHECAVRQRNCSVIWTDLNCMSCELHHHTDYMIFFVAHVILDLQCYG